jgi:hypothetical protein
MANAEPIDFQLILELGDGTQQRPTHDPRTIAALGAIRTDQAVRLGLEASMAKLGAISHA